MAVRITKVDYFSMQISNRAGEAVRLLKALKKGKINLLAFTGFPNGKGAQIDFFPEKVGAFRKVARQIGLPIGKPKKAFLVRGKDRAGAIASFMDPLGMVGINITAIDAVSAPKNRFAAIFWVKPKDFTKAAKVLGAK
jgi:hypothetical protein